MIKLQQRFDFKKANGAKLIDKQDSFWLCAACLSVGVIIGFASGSWFAGSDGLHVNDISEETMERIRLGIENIRLKRELNEQKASQVVQ